jgi:Fur family ferric uptake transcriptional regulator
MKQNFVEKAEQLCKKCNVKFTEQRRIIAKIINDSTDHPDVEQVFIRSAKFDSNLNLATVYRTMNLFENLGILKKHYFGDNRARYESTGELNHDHLIDINSNAVIEFSNNELEKIIKQITEIMGYELVNYNLEVYAIKKDDKKVIPDNINEKEEVTN